MLLKIIEIHRFHHNWMRALNTKRPPAIQSSLANGKLYERDIFGE